MNLRLTRIDVALLGALVFSSWALSFFTPTPSRQAPLKSQRSSWQQEQDQVKERLKETFSVDRETLLKRVKENPALFYRIRVASLLVSLVLIGSALGLIRLILWLFLGRPVWIPLGSPLPPAWGLREVLRLGIGALLVAQGALLIERWAVHLLNLPWLDRHVASLGNTLLVECLVIAFGFVLLSRARALQKKGPGLWMGLRFAFGSYLTFLPLLWILVALVVTVLQRIGIEPTPQPIFTIFLSETRAPVIGWLLLLATLLGPIAEELFFRGLLYGCLRVRIGVFKALTVSSLLFATLHFDGMSFFPILGLGFLFGWVYERTGTLVAPVAIHIFHNGGMLSLAWLLKGLI